MRKDTVEFYFYRFFHFELFDCSSSGIIVYVKQTRTKECTISRFQNLVVGVVGCIEERKNKQC